MNLRSKTNLITATLFLVFAFSNFGYLLSTQLVASEDLPAHVHLASKLRAQLFSGRIVFYDTSWFTGWAAHAFYGFSWSLLVVLISLPLGLFVAEPVVLANNLALFCCLLILPITIYRAARLLVERTYPLQPRLREYKQLSLSILSFSICIWYYYHDGQFFGVGLGAYAIVGLAPQLLAHILLLCLFTHCLSLASNQGRRVDLKFSLLFCLLLWTHLLTAAYFLFFCFIYSLLFRREFLNLWTNILIGFLLSAVWLLPFLIEIPNFTLADPYPNKGDILALIFRYPAWQLLQGLIDTPLLTLQQIQLFPLLFLALTLVLAIHPEIRRTVSIQKIFIGVLLTSFLLTSNYLAYSLPFGFHYYRFHSNTLLLLLPIFAAVGTICTISRDEKTRSIQSNSFATVTVCSAALIATLTVLRFPPLELEKANLGTRQLGYQSLENVTTAIGENENSQRIFVEYANNYKLHPYLSGHYLDSRIFNDLGKESVGGLFVESSLRFRYLAVITTLLGAKVFSPYLIFANNYKASPAELIEELKNFGIDTIVASSPTFIENLKKLGYAERKLDQYTIFKLENSLKQISKLQGVKLGYFDPDSKLSFNLLSFYFAARKSVLPKFELIEVNNLNSIPNDLDFLLSTERGVSLPTIPVLPFSIPENTISHYTTEYPVAKSILEYRKLAANMDSQLDSFRDLMHKALSKNTVEQSPIESSLTWSDSEQVFTLSNLALNRLYKLNYSYTPYLSCQDCKLFRGGSNEIVIEALKDSARIRFSIAHALSFWIGALISCITAASCLVLLVRKKPS